MANAADTPSPAQRNVALIATLEEEALHRRSTGERISDALTKRTGTLGFVVLQVLGVISWCVINLNLLPGVTPFDPFPFGILSLIVSAEGVVLATFVLMSQNRMSRQADRRAHLDLQITLLAEQEMTGVLHMLHAICAHFHLQASGQEETQQLMEKTDVQELVSELKEKLPTE